MDEIYRSKGLNYGFIVIMTLLALIFLYNVNVGNFEDYIEDVNLSEFSLKLVFSLVIVVTYITFVMPSFKFIGENIVLEKTPPRGDQGPRGNRGNMGENAACKECGDELCQKKILYNITKTINFWRQKNGMKLFNDNYIIENEYIKDKVKKHCASKEFKTLLNKYGANNKNSGNEYSCPAELNTESLTCGAYDYLFKMWSIWILIILRYENGLMFLESYGLTEKDFPGMITKNDAFQIGASVSIVNEALETIDSPLTIYDNQEFPFYKLSRSSIIQSDMYHITQLRQTSDSGTWNDMFSDIENMPTATVKDKILRLDKVKRQIDNDNNFIFNGINDVEIKKIGNVPGGGLLSPFDEIKKYSAWSWGSDPALKPQFVIEETEENIICSSCVNSSLCNLSNPSGGVKFKISNMYKTLVDTSSYKSITNSDGDIIPFNRLLQSDFSPNEISIDEAQNNNYTFLRPQRIVDSKEHPYFREYKPLGDVIFKNTDFTRSSNRNDLLKCKPGNINYDDEIFEAIIGTELSEQIDISEEFNSDSLSILRTFINANNHIYTLLVSGDTKPPIDFELVARYNKSTGLDANFEGITIWKPIPELNYKAVGFVIDTRPFDPSNSDNYPNKPPRDIIATIPNNVYVGNINSISDDIKFLNLKRTKFNTFINDDTLNLVDNNSNIVCIPENSQYSGILPTISVNIASNTDSNTDSNEVINSEFKNKKYSIQKIYDNNNE